MSLPREAPRYGAHIDNGKWHVMCELCPGGHEYVCQSGCYGNEKEAKAGRMRHLRWHHRRGRR